MMRFSILSGKIRTMFAVAIAGIAAPLVPKPAIGSRDWVIRQNTARTTNGQRGGIAQAKREALKAKRRKAHKRRVR
jgi:hypothetical protein